MVRAREYVRVKHFQGLPKRDDYEIEEYELPALKPGEILVKVEWVSVDPSYRYSQYYPPRHVGYQVGQVIDSKAPEFPVGSKVVSFMGWCDYCIIDTTKPHPTIGKIYKVPERMKGLPDSYAVGAVGMPGATAYLGLLDICKPKAGETVVVTGAAGAVGTIVGQIAKIKGCRVIGFAGSDEKVKWLEEIGFDKAINYKTANIEESLKEAAPNGVDCFFDNVGGELSSTIMYQMNLFGRVVIVGNMFTLNSESPVLPKATILQPAILTKRLLVQGFGVYDWLDRFPEAFDEIITWIKAGKMKVREHVTEGFDKIFDAFVGMLQGENTGKAVVKL